MAIVAGDRIGPYQILSALGAGGMGEVFKARDTRLDRTVALKMLPAAIAADSVARERFEREARAVAALNHPNICTLHDIGRYDSPSGPIDYFVMEFIEGETLMERLSRGPLRLTQAVDCAVQVAEALDRAHLAGVVHRDVKPSNIMLGKDTCKLLDFGVAKTPAMSASATTAGWSAAPLTDRGTIIGTVQYMAPEQIEGRPVDGRVDIFSLGAVLYEAITGRKAFGGGSQASVMAAILNNSPAPVSQVQPLASPFLDHVVQRCLEKDPNRRWQSARDLMLELESVSDMTDRAAATPVRSPRRPLAALAAIAGIGIVAGAAGVWLLQPPASRTPTAAPVIEQVTRLTHEVGFSQSPTWAPDGRVFAFASNRNGNFEIYVRRIEGGQEVNVTNHAANDVQPAFSPDGNSIAFISTRSSRTDLVKIGTYIGFDTRTYGGDVWVTPALGGQPRRLAENGNLPVWHSDGRSVIFIAGSENRRAIHSVGLDDNKVVHVLPETASSWEITRLGYAPDGRWITFETDRRIFIMEARGGTPRELLRGSSHRWDSSGSRIYYANQDIAGGTRIEVAELNGGRDPGIARTRLVGVSTGVLNDLDVTSDGRRLLASGMEESMNLTRIALAPGGATTAGPEEELSTGQVRDRYPVVSPDGRRIAVSTNRLGIPDLWVLDMSRGHEWRRVGLGATSGLWVPQACWGEDGSHLLVMRFLDNGTTDYQYVALDGSSSTQLIDARPAVSGNFACQFSPDGKSVLYSHITEGFSQIFVMDFATRRSRQLTSSASHKYEATWSPDGRWVAFSANTGGTIQVWRLPSGGGKEEQLTHGYGRTRHLFYASDGRWLYVQPDHGNIQRIPADGGDMQPVTQFQTAGLFIEEPTISPDGKWLVYNRGRGGASIWMLTIGAP